MKEGNSRGKGHSDVVRSSKGKARGSREGGQAHQKRERIRTRKKGGCLPARPEEAQRITRTINLGEKKQGNV